MLSGFAHAGTSPDAGIDYQSMTLEELINSPLEELLNAPVTTASGGRAEERSLSSANVTSISRAEIHRHGWRSLGELLTHVPGLYLVDDLVLPSIGVRGITGGLRSGTRMVRVMVDGVQVNFRPDLTAFIGPEYLPLDAIERVEIAKGPLSALYGPNAFLATINVITRKSENAAAAEVAARGQYGASTGPTGSGLVSYSSATRGVLAAIVWDYQDRSGLRLSKTFPSQDVSSPIFQRSTTRDGRQGISVFGKVWAGSPEAWGSWVLQGGFQQLDTLGEFQLSSVLTHRTRIQLNNLWANARYEKQWSATISSTASVGWAEGAPGKDDQQWLTQSTTSYFRRNFGYRAFTASIDTSYNPNQQIGLKLGVDTELDLERALYVTEVFNRPSTEGMADSVDRIDRDSVRQFTVSDLGVYLQATSAPLPRLPDLRLTGNLRLDWVTHGPISFPTQYSWRLAAAYRWSPQITTKLIGGHAFQTPSGVLMFGYPGLGSENNVIGNASRPGLFTPLKPQAVTSVELVASAQLLEIFALELAGYFQEVSDKIELLPFGTDYFAANRGIGRNVGAEATLSIVKGRWTGVLSASVQKSLNDAVTESEPEGPPPFYPDLFGRAGVELSLAEAHLLVVGDLRWSGPRGASPSNVHFNNRQQYTLPAYVALDFALSSQGLYWLGPSLETKVTLGMKNAFNQQKSEPGAGGIDIPTVGRSVFLEVRQQL